MAHVEIPLANGKGIALVDEADAALVQRYRWHRHSRYAAYAESVNGRLVFTMMHHLILSDNGMFDHINGNPLDNRRSNLRPATHAQNMRNRKTHKNNKCGYKGVYWAKAKGKWRVRINFEKRRYHIGEFSDLESAARAYDEAALKFHGEFARLNFDRMSR
jgi:hypothetical protein